MHSRAAFRAGLLARRPVIALGSMLLLAALARADERSPAASDAPRRWQVDQSLGASYNRLGLQHELGLRWTRPLTASRRLLLQDAHLAAGVLHTLTPSYMRVALWTEVAPLSIVTVRAGAEPGSYFGTFGSLRSYASYESDYGPGAEVRPPSQFGDALRLYVAPSLRLKVGTIAFSGTSSVERWSSGAAGPYFYEPSRDTLLSAAGDTLVAVSALLVRQTPFRGGQLSYGLVYERIDVLDGAVLRSQRAGIVLARRFGAQWLGQPSPSVGLKILYYVEDRTRQGQLAVGVGLSVTRDR